MSSEDGLPSDPLESISAGVTYGGLDWTKEQIKSFVVKFRNKDLAFIADSATIDIAKEMRQKGEFDFFSEHIKDKSLRVLFQLGLTLRELEIKSKHEDIRYLREKIYNKYGTKGLHIASFVQNGLFSMYIGNILGKASNRKVLSNEIQQMLENIDNIVVFIRQEDDINYKSNEILTKIFGNTPQTFIISSVKPCVVQKCREIKDIVMSKVSSNYECELYSVHQQREIYFLSRRKDES